MRFHRRATTPIGVREGVRIESTIRWRGSPFRWLTEIEEWRPGDRFVDGPHETPYRLWRHTHSLRPCNGGTEVRDFVQDALPLGPIETMTHALLVRLDVEAIFDNRAQRVRLRMAAARARGFGGPMDR